MFSLSFDAVSAMVSLPHPMYVNIVRTSTLYTYVRILDVDLSASSAGTVSILLNNGDGTFRNQIIYSVMSHPMELKVADFNNDINLV